MVSGVSKKLKGCSRDVLGVLENLKEFKSQSRKNFGEFQGHSRGFQ